ncbi:hypothetical protein ACPXCG_18800 [Gordonia sp. DT218]|uniref:hypothetical protein n=1 Tax=Gordonia sp. DT218 TaxID=3416659 RepID=UPI003CF2A133
MKSLTEVIAEHRMGMGMTFYRDGTCKLPTCACGESMHPNSYAAHVSSVWEEERTIRTVEELDALPVGAVVQELPAEHTWIRHSTAWHCSCDGTDVEWSTAEVVHEATCRPEDRLIVLYLPEEA